MPSTNTPPPAPLDHQTIDDQAIAERYVTGRLSAEWVEAFEEHYLDCPQCVARVESAERLQRGLARVVAQDVARQAATGGLLAQVLRHRAARIALPMLLLGLAIGPAAWQQGRIDRLVAEHDATLARVTAPQVGGKFFELAPLRGEPHGDEPVTVLGLPYESSAPLVFALDVPAVADIRGYRVDLRDQEETLLWSSGIGSLDHRGRLVLSLPADRMPTGNVELRVVAVPVVPGHGDRPVARFPLSVLRVS